MAPMSPQRKNIVREMLRKREETRKNVLIKKDLISEERKQRILELIKQKEMRKYVEQEKQIKMRHYKKRIKRSKEWARLLLFVKLT